MGRPRKINERDGRALIRGLQRLRAKGASISVKRIVKESGLSFELAHRRTFSRFLNEKGYGFFQRGGKEFYTKTIENFVSNTHEK